MLFDHFKCLGFWVLEHVPGDKFSNQPLFRPGLTKMVIHRSLCTYLKEKQKRKLIATY